MNLICGVNPVLEALSAAVRHFDRLLIVKGIRNRRIAEAISRASRLGVPLRFEGRETLDRLAAGVPHQGIIAVVSAKPLIGLDDLLAAAREPAMVVVLDGIEDPRNLGAILRTVEASGADGVLLPERHSAGLSETVARASAGALDHVRVARIGNLVQALETLKSRGFWVVGLDASGSERWDAVDYRRPIALVLGGEGRGIRRLVRERCDHLASVPLFGHLTSLNVAVVAGIALYEAVRQRGSVPSQVRPIPFRPTPARQVVGPGPGDDEQDPGLPLAAGVGRTVVDDDGGGGDEAPEPIDLVELNEEAAWSGPVVLARRGPGPRRGWRRGGPPSPNRPRQEGELRPTGEGRENGARPSAESAGPRPAPGRSGRRRRRRRHAGRADSRSEGRAAEFPPPPGGDGPAPPGPSGPDQTDRTVGPRRFRRRRRRR
jgi:23S rRNA (guanosine2251-2'-O)-methyltransferase